MSDFAGSFGSLVRQYISDHSLSYQDFASAMGFKSKTSIARIIQDETSYELRAQFFSRLSEQYPLSEKEELAFRNALRISRLSPQDRKLFRCFSDVLQADYNLKSYSDIAYRSAGQMETLSLSDLLAARSNASSLVTVSIFGLPGTPFITTLYKLLSETHRPFAIRHYVFCGEDILPQLRSVTDSAPFLFDPRYTLYSCRCRPGQAMPDNHLILRYVMQDGSASEDVFLLSAQEPMIYSGPMHSSFTDLYHSFFLPALEPVPALKTAYAQDSLLDQLNAYFSMQEAMISLEEDCALYCLRKGLGEEFIPPEIFQNAVQPYDLSPPDAKKVLSNLLRIQKRRHQHLLSQKKPLYFVLSQSDFQHFVWTGRFANQPPFLRPLSPRERYDTLTLLIAQIQQNPYFSIRFANESLHAVCDHLTLTGYHYTQYASSHQAKRIGGLLIQPGPRSSSQSACVMLADNALASAFSQFFREELNAQYVEPARTTLRFQYNMLEYLQSRL